MVSSPAVKLSCPNTAVVLKYSSLLFPIANVISADKSSLKFFTLYVAVAVSPFADSPCTSQYLKVSIYIYIYIQPQGFQSFITFLLRFCYIFVTLI